MNWITVNLPWSEVYGSEPQPPNTDAEERDLFNGETYNEVVTRLDRKYTEMREAFYAQTLDQEPRITSQALNQLNAENDALLNTMGDQVMALPAYQAFLARRTSALEAHKKTYFSSQAKPGMVIELDDGQRFVLGDFCVQGGIGTEVFPLEGKFVVRYCMLELPK